MDGREGGGESGGYSGEGRERENVGDGGGGEAAVAQEGEAQLGLLLRSSKSCTHTFLHEGR